MTATAMPRVMIVDDVRMIRTGVTRVIEDAGMQVVGAARDGEEAIELGAQLQPDVILLDIVMPVLQGLEALPRLRELLPQCVILMLTSTSERSLALQAKQRGADGFIIKGADLAAIPERVLRAWQRRQQHG